MSTSSHSNLWLLAIELAETCLQKLWVRAFSSVDGEGVLHQGPTGRKKSSEKANTGSNRAACSSSPSFATLACKQANLSFAAQT